MGLATAPPVTTIPRMKDAVAFLAFMRGLLSNTVTTLHLGDNGLTATICDRGHCYSYTFDAADLEKQEIDLAGELARIHEKRVRDESGASQAPTPSAAPHDRVPGLEQANTEAIAKLKAKLDRVTAHRDALSRPCPNGRLSKADQGAVDLAMVIESLLEHGLCSFDDFNKRCPGSSRSMFETNVAMLTVADVTVVQHPHGEPLWGLTDEACDTARWEGCLPLARRLLAERAEGNP